MWSDGEPIDPSPTIDQAVNEASPGWRSGARYANSLITRRSLIKGAAIVPLDAALRSCTRRAPTRHRNKPNQTAELNRLNDIVMPVLS